MVKSFFPTYKLVKIPRKFKDSRDETQQMSRHSNSGIDTVQVPGASEVITAQNQSQNQSQHQSQSSFQLAIEEGTPALQPVSSSSSTFSALAVDIETRNINNNDCKSEVLDGAHAHSEHAKSSPNSLPPLVNIDERVSIGEMCIYALQHFLSMFSSTVLIPLLMGFDLSTTLLFSGIGTLIFFFTVQGRVPSYLGASAAFLGPTIASTGYSNPAYFGAPNPQIQVAQGKTIHHTYNSYNGISELLY
jgi:hypothetical protein